MTQCCHHLHESTNKLVVSHSRVSVWFCFVCLCCLLGWWRWQPIELCTGPSPVLFCGLNNRWPWILLGDPFLRACFFLRFEVQKRSLLCHIVLLQFIALRPSRPTSKPALTCFVLISMVSRHWSSRLALRPASNFVSPIIFWFAAISITLKPRGLPWGRPFAPAAA